MASYRRIVSKINDVVERWHLHSLLEKRYRKILQLNGIHNKEVCLWRGCVAEEMVTVWC